jgi:hypothetical protein
VPVAISTALVGTHDAKALSSPEHTPPYKK